MAIPLQDLIDAATPEKVKSGIPLETLIAAAGGSDVPNQASVQAMRESSRPDLSSELLKKTQAPYTTTDPGQLTSRMFTTGLTAVGAGAQAQENFQAAPVVNRIRAMKGEKLGPTDILGHEAGQNKTEFGDIARELGMPEWIAAPAGLVAASVLDPLQSGYKIGSRVAHGIEKTGSVIHQGIATIFNVVGLGHTLDESSHLIKGGGYEGLGHREFKNIDEVAQETGNAMVKQLYSVFKKPAQQAYDNIASKIAARKLTPFENKEIVKSLSGVLGKERNAVAVQKVLDTDIGKSAISRTTLAKPPVSKTVTTASNVEYPGKKIVSEAGQTATVGNVKKAEALQKTASFDKEADAYRPAGTSKISTKTTVTSTSVSASQAQLPAAIKPRTVQDLLNDIARGKPVNARDWDTVSQELKRISGVAEGKDPTASKAAEAIDSILHTYVPELKEASDKWSKYTKAEEQLKNVVGDWDEAGRVTNPTKMLDYFKRGVNSVTRGNIDSFDLALRNEGASGVSSSIKNAASYATNVTPYRPALTALSLGGGAAGTLYALGVPSPVIAAVGTLVAGGLTPALSAKYGKTLASNADRLRRVIDAPAGRYLMNKAPSGKGTDLMREAVAHLLGRGISQAAFKGVAQVAPTLSE